MATKKKETTKTKKELTPEQVAKRKARMEAIKNRPAGQRPNSKTLDIIEGENGTKVRNFGHLVKSGRHILGVLVTSVVYDAKGNIISSSVTFVNGEINIKSKKGHGNFCKPKHTSDDADDEEDEDDTPEEDNNED